MNCQFCNSTESIEIPGLGHFCISCLEKSKLCDVCGKVHLASDFVIIGENFVCSTCAGDVVLCKNCGKKHVKSFVHRGFSYCEVCAQNFSACDVCGKIHKNKEYSIEDKLKYDISEKICALCFSKIKQTKEPKEVFSCKVCGVTHTNKTEFKDTPCTDCVTTSGVCVVCGEHRHKLKSKSSNGNALCYDCYRTKTQHYVYCTCCRNLFNSKDCKDGLCKECIAKYIKCELCGAWEQKIRSKTVDDLNVCVDCYYKCKCTTCGKVTVHTEKSSCYSCCDTHKIDTINNYSYKPRFIKYGNGLHLGIENEIANVKDKQRRKLQALPRAWMFMKSDSSVDCGVECVFHPTTLQYFKSKKEILDKHFVEGLSRHSTAGMHVHIPKDMFGVHHLFKFIQFFNNNNDFIEKIAERKNSTYSRPLSDKSTKLAKMAKECDKKSDRYRHINILNDKTIEVRIFAGVVDTASFLKNIEFCDALFNYTKTTSAADGEFSSVELFTKYVFNNTSTYNNLYTFLGGKPKKEIPEKYKPKVDVVDNIVETTPVSGQILEGSRVVLVQMEDRWELGEYNPLQGTGFQCSGTVTRIGLNDIHVLWDNSCHNTYFQHNLSLVGEI